MGLKLELRKTIAGKKPALMGPAPSFMNIPFYTKEEKIKEASKKYKKYRNIVVCGTGASASAFECLAPLAKKNCFVLDAPHPERILETKKHCKKKDTIVFLVSKSGETLEVKALYKAFCAYKKVAITLGGFLSKDCQKKDTPIYPLPDVSGRFGNISTASLLPAMVAGVDIKEVLIGARKSFSKCFPRIVFEKNPAKRLASFLFSLYKKGYDEIFYTAYSEVLAPTHKYLSQLILESLGKKRKGPTIFGGTGPRVQHEAIQRVICGKKNVAALFVGVKNYDKDVKIGSTTASKIIRSEMKATILALKEAGVPTAQLTLSRARERDIGELLSFFQATTYYYGLLLKINMFNQPGVQRGKELAEKMVIAPLKSFASF